MQVDDGMEEEKGDLELGVGGGRGVSGLIYKTVFPPTGS